MRPSSLGFHSKSDADLDYEKELEQWPELNAMLDKTNIYNTQNIYNITKSNNWYDDDGIHPGLEAHQMWARLIQPMIK
jgi:lysophospholipase L1-like esterase